MIRQIVVAAAALFVAANVATASASPLQKGFGGRQAAAPTWMPLQLLSPVPRAHRAGLRPMGDGFMSAAVRSKSNKLVYFSDLVGGAVDVYDQAGSNQTPIGQIKAGVSEPLGVYVDPGGRVYVCHWGTNTVTIYRNGGTRVSAKLLGAHLPTDVAIDPVAGKTYVVQFDSPSILIYPYPASTRVRR